MGEQAKVFERMREAEALAETIDDQRRLGQISAYLSGYFVQAGDDPIQAMEKGERALRDRLSNWRFQPPGSGKSFSWGGTSIDW